MKKKHKKHIRTSLITIFFAATIGYLVFMGWDFAADRLGAQIVLGALAVISLAGIALGYVGTGK